MSSVVSFGVIGWTRASGRLADHLADLPHARLLWICDPPSELRLGPLAHRLGARRTYDPDVLLDDERVDAVIVCAPYAQRAALIARSLEADKHVLVLGPAAASRVETARLLKLAQARGRVLDATTAFLHDPALAALETRILAGSLGELLYLHGDCSAGEGSGSLDVLSDLAADDIAALLRLAHDRPVEIDAGTQSFVAPDSVDLVECRFRFVTGFTARLTYSRVDATTRHVLRVVGARAAAVLNRSPASDRLVIHDRSSDEGTSTLSVRIDPTDPYVRLCEEFLTAVRTCACRTSPAEIDAVAEAMEAVSNCLARNARSTASAAVWSSRVHRSSQGDLSNVRAAHL